MSHLSIGQTNPRTRHSSLSAMESSAQLVRNSSDIKKPDSEQATGVASYTKFQAGLIQIASILQWWFFNVATVILNKYIFQQLKFQFPLLLSTIHFIISSMGAYLFLQILKLRPLVEVKANDKWTRIFPMSVVFCMNIVLGNVSLASIPVSFMQTVKSLTPATTVFLQRAVWGRQFDYRIYLSLLPVVGGIVITSVTELSFVWKGFIAAMTGCFATSTKTILAESLLHGKYNFDSLNTVYYMAPYATLLLIFPGLLLEGPDMYQWFLDQESLVWPLSTLLLSGVIAFSLNYSIFYVIQTTSALTFNVAGNMKTAVAIFSSWLLFRNPMSILNVFGCSITLLGCTLYGYVRQCWISGKVWKTDMITGEIGQRLGSRAVVEVVAQEEILPLKANAT